MRLEYRDNKLKRICTDEREMRKRCSDIEAKLKARLAALRRAETAGDLMELDPLGDWHPLSADLKSDWAGKVRGNERILVTPIGEFEDARDATAVLILSVRTDYHGRDGRKTNR